jgi:hypothetical protein
MKTYEMSYNFIPVVTVQVEDSSLPFMKDMVEFWTDWERALDRNDGDYKRAWLKQLARFVLQHGRSPEDDEGWCALDGSHGIKVTEVLPWEFEDEDIDIEEERER